MSLFICWLDKIDAFLWSYLLLFLLAATGIWLTIRLKGLQLRSLPYALKLAFGSRPTHDKGDISHFQALMVALAATIGMGNIAGVATAVALGGLGALFWMWVLALLGMATKYAEGVLAIKYRTFNDKGEVSGGPMYYIEKGLGWKWLAVAFALFGATSALGTGNLVQSNSVAQALGTFGVAPMTTGMILVILVGIVTLGGVKTIGRVSSVVVPVMAALYIVMGLIILFVHADRIPSALDLILTSAFTGHAAFGGFAGATMLMACQYGAARGIFSNESGLGTAPIAAAAARTDAPSRQALVSMTGTFLDTIIVCSITGLVIAVTGVLGEVDASGKVLTGVSMTMVAFNSVLPYGDILLTIAVFLFAYSTIVGWAYYGEKCCEYLLGERSVIYYRVLYTLVVIPGSLLGLQLVWTVADITNALMAFPNLIGLLFLSGVVVKETKAFSALRRHERELAKLPPSACE